MNLDIDLKLFTKNNSKWITDLNIKHKTIKPKKITGDNLDDFEFGNDLLDTAPNSQFMKEIINKLCFIKIRRKLLCKKQYHSN